MPNNTLDFQIDLFDYLGKGKDNFFFIIDLEQDCCRWSANAVEVFMLPGERIETTGFWQELIHPADIEYFTDDCQNIQRRNTRQVRGEYRFRLRKGGYVWVQCNGRMISSPSGEKNLLSGIVSRLQTRANIDPVTNLRYIGGFRAALSDIVTEPVPWGILLFGIDDFKRINDLYSYTFGDEVLADFSNRLQDSLPNNALLFRMDGDGFGILYPNMDADTVVRRFDEIQTLAQTPVRLGNIYVSFSVSGGICRYPEDGTDGDSLYRNARIAFIESKMLGKKQITICSPPLCARAQRRMRILEKLRECVQNDYSGFHLSYQPLIEAGKELLYGCEVLMRWKHPEFPEGVTPYEFIPILENSGLIFDVNKWLMQEAFAQCAQWVKIMPSFQMNINFSCAQFEATDFKSDVMQAISKAGVPASAITLELTESGEVSDMERVNQVFNFLRAQGIKIALDDFGTGYSSLSIFQMLSADELKIDRSFLQRLTYNVTDQTLVRQIIELCHSMNMMVCVEGVETSEVIEIVRQFGPELLQGFYYSRPLTAAEFYERFFADKSILAQAPEAKQSLAQKHSMVYAPLRPMQPLSMDTVVNSAHAGFFQVAMDENFSFITCNEGYRKMLGYTAVEMEKKFGNHALGIVYPEDMEYVNEEIRRQLGEGDTITIEFRVVRSDGVPIWILGTGSVVKTESGMSSLIVVIVDNDRLKLEQLEKDRIRKRYELLLNNLPNGMKCVRYDEDFTLDYISPGFLSLTGFTLEDIHNTYGGKYINLIHEEDRGRVINDILEQLKVSNLVTMHYRTPCKDGSLLWVETVSRLCPPEEDGIQRAYSSVIAVTSEKVSAKDRTSLSIANRFQSVTEQWGDVLFEYVFTNDSVAFSENYQTMFGRTPKSEMSQEEKNIHPDDLYLLDKALETIHYGAQPDPFEVRCKSETRGYIWCLIAFGQPDMIGPDPVSVIGRISDIDAKKHERDKLLIQSRLDAMTTLLNKGTVEEEIRLKISTLAPEKQYALCVIDIDNFKWINDSHGHSFGDTVLVQTANRLQSLLGNSSPIGRAGGDEFIAFVPLVAPFSTAESLGAALVKQLNQPIALDGSDIKVSASIGIACCPKDASDFYHLFQFADRALYLCKSEEKGAFRVSLHFSSEK